MSFADLGLKPELARAVSEKGYVTATPIQSQAIPAVLADRDVLAGAQTGTGKTAAFVLPVLQKLAQASGRAPRALVLTPTRELAAQVAESAAVYGKYLNVRTAVVFGGVSINPQIGALRAGCDLLVATPGRLLDLADQRAVDLREINCLVLDEADRMLDMGFIRPIRQILELLPPRRQNLMFSATYSDDIRNLAKRYLRDPVNVEVTPRNSTAERVDQQVYRVSKEHKRHLLAHLITSNNWHQVLVFNRTKHGANRLAQQLESYGIRAAAIHGNKSQGARVRALADFKANAVTVLVATEVAARGLDIKELPHVVNYELPNVPEDYVHRIGRTARAGTTGSAVSLVSPDEAGLLRDIERMLRQPLPVSEVPEFPILTPTHAPANGDSSDSSADRDSSGRRDLGRRAGDRGGRGRSGGRDRAGGQSRGPRGQGSGQTRSEQHAGSQDNGRRGNRAGGRERQAHHSSQHQHRGAADRQDSRDFNGNAEPRRQDSHDFNGNGEPRRQDSRDPNGNVEPRRHESNGNRATRQYDSRDQRGGRFDGRGGNSGQGGYRQGGHDPQSSSGRQGGQGGPRQQHSGQGQRDGGGQRSEQGGRFSRGQDNRSGGGNRASEGGSHAGDRPGRTSFSRA